MGVTKKQFRMVSILKKWVSGSVAVPGLHLPISTVRPVIQLSIAVVPFLVKSPVILRLITRLCVRAKQAILLGVGLEIYVSVD